jgi:cytidine deaminase
MEKKEIIFKYEVLENSTSLPDTESNLLQVARSFTANAYAPYSNFNVAASALLDDGSIYSGTNQENASYPVGMCAERTLLATIANVATNKKIICLAISYYNKAKDKNDIPATPCGMCRQALVEWGQRQQQSFKLLLSGQTGKVYIIENAATLLPLSFEDDFLK